MTKKVTVLGSTGSIGTQTLDVIANDRDQYEIEGLAAGNNVSLLIEQAKQFHPTYVCVASKEAAEEVKLHLPAGTKVYYGEQGLIEIAAAGQSDMVVTAIVGSRGLGATLAAIRAGKAVGLANKETLVTAGHLVMSLAQERGVAVLPIDSEHSAIFQCLNGESRSSVKRITLTASGGSFRDRTREELANVTVEQALKHPNWSMGAKITIDSATMANKGLEVIEARWLYDIDYDDIGVVIHPESIIHSYVEFEDHSVMAQLGLPDMRVPIQYALTYPARRPTPTGRLDLVKQGTLHFREMDEQRYPMMKLAYAAGRAAGTATTVFNAANEVAVARFLRGEIGFLDIERVVESVLEKHTTISNPDEQTIAETDQWARQQSEVV
ncbi:1-deoxy-D-xylulose 5-phosphate reductoisomerase [Paenibacillus cellulosilyticus]|uniref:1-deoxy-D-xylulose 5-phosphate reductoisomerase n=1 Tax=Paenibacillus cellulosilyticus TaxID=375489 RepID=A0A2V2YXG0_9BACL|nr:1-deoxy-D-xylulose-5-phosphate reductoisomerase [Paenibacillus cellulosilyticus]PWW06432.1 1-deoxy-D-xylulose 5-phosphate reductoisomerase [Paenibacillus cellulosilyticus]QKS46222.1 1-deoxy-D-xylulose-5-phosphate reductoisomerase [Paenibacillus cellulosilyticus]